jgi:Anti-sigma-K factor rskA
LAELRELLGAPSTWREPDPGLEQRVVDAIADAANRPAEARRRPAADAERAPRAARSPAGARVPSWLRRLRPVYGLAALGTAAAVAIVIAVTAGSSSPKALHFAMVVTGTPLAPHAHGSASLTKTASGWRIELSANGLPHLANGRYYQAWLKNAAGILVPVGTFNDARKVTLWSGVPVTQYRTLTVTIQQAGGDPASSGRRVLVGTIRPSG